METIAGIHLSPGFTLPALERQLREGLSRARATGGAVLVSHTTRCDSALSDPTAVVLRSRRPGEHWWCFEQPEREGFALAALGCACECSPGVGGGDRFGEVQARWRALSAAALAEPPSGPPGSGLVAVGGFAFAPEGAQAPEWTGYAPASMVVPEVSIARRHDQVWLTLNAEVAPDDTVADRVAQLAARVRELGGDSLPLLDPAPVGEHRVHSTMPPAHYESAVERAVELIGEGGLEKVVLGRQVEVAAPRPYDPAGLLGVLREAFASCYVFAIGRDSRTFLGASPELLVRREGQRASTVALAGSTRRSADPAVDDHLGERLLRSAKDREENAIVARRIAGTLRARAVWVTAAREPVLVRVANIQHLATPIRAQLADPIGAIELAGMLHPTPAVGGEPLDRALELIPALEGMDRGWYAGPVGWADANGDGEFCVALRCALLDGAHARLYAGCGIVAGSDPASELAESEVKLQALLPLLSG